jgi:membrane protein required for colicin V production
MELGKILTYINWVDIIVLILLFRTSYVGFTRGLGNEIMPLIAIFIALIASHQLYGPISRFIAIHTPLSSPHAGFLFFIFIAMITLLVFRFFNKLLVGKDSAVHVATMYDSACGLILGILRGVLLVSLVVYALWLTPSEYVSSSVEEKSLLAKKFLRIGPLVRNRAMRVLKHD